MKAHHQKPRFAVVCLDPFLAGKLYLVQSGDRCILLQQITWVSSSLWLHLGGALCGFLLSGVSAFRQNRMEANMTNMEANMTNMEANMVTKMQCMETNMQSMAATLQRIEKAITERDDGATMTIGSS